MESLTRPTRPLDLLGEQKKTGKGIPNESNCISEHLKNQKLYFSEKKQQKGDAVARRKTECVRGAVMGKFKFTRNGEAVW